MPILTRYERWALILLSIGLFGFGVFLIFSSGPSFSCWTPAEFTSEMSSHTRRLCSTKRAKLYDIAPNASDRKIPSRVESGKSRSPISYAELVSVEWIQVLSNQLFSSMTLLLIPLVIADILTRVFDAVGANEKSLSTVSIVVRSLSELICRAALFVCLALALSAIKSEPLQSKANSTHRLIQCEFSIRKLSTIHLYNVECALPTDQRLFIATSMIYIAKRILVLVVSWGVIGFVQSLILIVCPSTRLSVLRVSSQKEKANAEPAECKMLEIK